MNNDDRNTTIKDLKALLLEFRNNRDWDKFHNPKDLAEAISIESSELLELFLWKTKEEITTNFKQDDNFKKDVEDELADVISYCFNFANTLNIDVSSAVINKIRENNKKYPVNKAKGVATKYNKL